MNPFEKVLGLVQQDSSVMDSCLPQFRELPFVLNDSNVHYRFFRINEISENNVNQYRMAMANVLASMGETKKGAFVYLLSGSPEGVDLYIGVTGEAQTVMNEAEILCRSFEGNFLGADLKELKEDHKHKITELFEPTRYLGLVTGVPSFNEEESNLEGVDFQGIERLINTLIDTRWQMIIVAETGSQKDIDEALNQIYVLSTELSKKIKFSIQQSENQGWSTTDTFGTSESETKGTSKSKTKGTNTSETEGSSRTKQKGVNECKGSNKGSSSSGTNESRTTTDGSSECTSQSKSSGSNSSTQTGENESTQKGSNKSNAVGKTNGESITVTREQINKHFEQLQTHLNDTQIARFLQGRSKGMYRTAVYLCAENRNTYNRLKRSVLSIFQGVKSSYNPLVVHDLKINQQIKLHELLQIGHIRAESYLAKYKDNLAIYSIPKYGSIHINAATWLTTRELSLLTGLPSLEVPGLKLRKSVAFALNTVDTDNDAKNICLGHIVQDGRDLKNKKIEIQHDALNKHVFVTGVTGSGKTTTCMKLLLDSGLPFTVIEPAKTEYRALYNQMGQAEIEYYALGREDLSTFRLNPFELVSKHQNLTGHVSMLKATICAVFPMEASMPFIVEQAIIEAYQDKGWDIANNTNYLIDDPWDIRQNAWPTFSEMISKLDEVIQMAKMGKEFEEKYRGSLVSRLTSLTHGIKGVMIDTPRSIDFDKLLDKKVVIELEELKDEEDKAFFMGLIIGRFAECMKQRHRKNPMFKHITLIEEAHRLLSKPEVGVDGSKKLGVDMFANLLAEVRKYGECLVIADQIPNKLVSDVIKNTNTKIIHRLFAADDRQTIGDSIGLNDEQKDFLPMLQVGETVVYSGGWHAAVRAKIDHSVDTTRPEISEGLIQEQGKKQLWEQREVLLPRFSQVYWLPEHQFADVFQAAREQINVLVMLARHHPMIVDGGRAKDQTIPAMVLKMATRLAQKAQESKKVFHVDEQQWGDLLYALLADTQLHLSEQAKEKEDFICENLVRMWAELLVSPEAFLMLIQSQPSKNVFQDTIATFHMI